MKVFIAKTHKEVHTHTFTCIHICAHTKHIYKHKPAQMPIHKNNHAHPSHNTIARANAQPSHTNTHIPSYLHMHTHTKAHTHTFTHKHTDNHKTHMYILTHAHTHRCSQASTLTYERMLPATHHVGTLTNVSTNTLLQICIVIHTDI